MDRIKRKETKLDTNPKVSPAAKPVTVKRALGLEYQRTILAAFGDARQFTSAELAASCETTNRDATFSRARQALVADGKLVAIGIGTGSSYRLADG